MDYSNGTNDGPWQSVIVELNGKRGVFLFLALEVFSADGEGVGGVGEAWLKCGWAEVVSQLLTQKGVLLLQQINLSLGLDLLLNLVCICVHDVVQ